MKINFSELIGYWTVPRCLNPSNLALYHTLLSKFFLIVTAWNWNLIIKEGFLTLALYWHLGLGNSSREALSCAQMFSSILGFYPVASLQLPCSVLTTKKMSQLPRKAKSPPLKITAIKERQPSVSFRRMWSESVGCSAPCQVPLSVEFPRQLSSHSLLQGIFPTQGSNLDLPHGGQILYHLSHQESSTVF